MDNHLGDIGLDGMITLRWKVRFESVGWIHPTQDRDLWRTRVTTVMNFRVPQKVENFLGR
jgi:hypothetical protein